MSLIRLSTLPPTNHPQHLPLRRGRAVILKVQCATLALSVRCAKVRSDDLQCCDHFSMLTKPFQAKTLSMLYTHCASHFHKRVEEKHTDLMHGLKCLLCGFMFKSKYLLTNHIACKHGKINDILKKKGFAVLPAPVLSTTNHAMQKQLVKVNVYFRVLFYLSHPISFPD